MKTTLVILAIGLLTSFSASAIPLQTDGSVLEQCSLLVSSENTYAVTIFEPTRAQQNFVATVRQESFGRTTNSGSQYVSRFSRASGFGYAGPNLLLLFSKTGPKLVIKLASGQTLTGLTNCSKSN
jgi:hypothetical protein